MARLIDRLLRRSDVGDWAGQYWPMGGAYAVSTADYGNKPGRHGEKPQAGFVRQVRDAYTANGPVFACVLARMVLFSECRFQFQRATDKKLYGNTSLRLLERPWPNATPVSFSPGWSKTSPWPGTPTSARRVNSWCGCARIW